jgi:threonine synthase
VNTPARACTACGAAAAPEAWRCACGGLLDLPEIALGPLRAQSGAGLWRYGPWIPVDPVPGLSMGEGGTALLDAGPDLPGVHVKLEFVFPTGSFKDRGAVVLVAAALERRAGALIADSSGNAGSAIAAYAARAGLDTTVFVPEGTSAGKQAQIRSYGARLQPVPGDRTAATAAAIAEVERTGSTYASHIYDPIFLQGTKTFAFEVWEQLGAAPDAVLVPVGNGTLLLGAHRGFRELRAAGFTDRLPALIALQSERCSPLAAAFAAGRDQPVEVPPAPATVAEGIAIPSPPRGAQILAAVRDTGGCVVSVPEAAIAPAANELARRGLLVEPTAALVWAAVLLLRGRLDIPVAPAAQRAARELAAWRAARELAAWRAARELAAATVVVPLCGSGLKAGTP